MIGKLYFYTDDDEDNLTGWSNHPPCNGEVCLCQGVDPATGWYKYSILRKESNWWKVTTYFSTYYPLPRAIGKLSEQKMHHLLAGYKLRELPFKQKETMH